MSESFCISALLVGMMIAYLVGMLTGYILGRYKGQNP